MIMFTLGTCVPRLPTLKLKTVDKKNMLEMMIKNGAFLCPCLSCFFPRSIKFSIVSTILSFVGETNANIAFA